MTDRHRHHPAVVIAITALIAGLPLVVLGNGDSVGGLPATQPDQPSSAAVARPDAAPAAGGDARAEATDTEAGPPPIIVPGRPGEPAATVPAGQVGPLPSPSANTMDTWFVRMMIPHHEQALAMAELALRRSDNVPLRAFAERVKAGQATEVRQLRSWLDVRGLPSDTGSHDHTGMPGMQSPEAMARLAAARGAPFDRLFVEMMTAHHQGAITMAAHLLRAGTDPRMQELATDIATEQAIEIDRLRSLAPA